MVDCGITGLVNTEGSKVGEEPSPRISPSRTFIATKAPGVLKAPSAASPAAWTRLSIVSSRLSPACGSSLAEHASRRLPWASTWTRVMPLAAPEDVVVGVLDPRLADLVAGHEPLVAASLSCSSVTSRT